ncbi:MAG: sensor histidine kinase [Hyphomicrobiales bacterium]
MTFRRTRSNGERHSRGWHVPSLVLFVVAAAVLIGAAISAYVNLTATTESSQEVTRASAASRALEEVYTSVNLAQATQGVYLVLRDPAYLQAYQSAVDAIPGYVDSIRPVLSTDPDQQRRLDELDPHVTALLAALKARLEIPATDTQALVAAATPIRAEADTVRALVREMQGAEDDLLARETARADDSVDRTALITSVIVGVAVLVLLLSYLFLYGEIRRRRRAEAGLARSLAAARDLYHHAPCGYHELDADGRVVSMNETELGWLGYTIDEVRGRPFDDLVVPVNTTSGVVTNLPLPGQGDHREVELQLIRKDGSTFPVLAATRVIDRGDGATRRMTVFDISDRRMTEDTIRQLNDELRVHAHQLEVANSELEAFSYSVSHDLRAPLRTIDGFSSALVEDYSDVLDDDGKHLLDRIRNATRHMGQLIDDLLALSRVARAELVRQHVDLSAMARSVAEELRASDPARNVEFVIAEGVTGDGDARLLRVVLENLLNNAWKYTARHETARIEFGATQANGATRYFVRDDGAGFDMRYADNLFGVFQRLHNVRDFPGTGVGLATVQRIIRRHGGEIEAEAEVEKGACFTFTLGPALAQALAA